LFILTVIVAALVVALQPRVRKVFLSGANAPVSVLSIYLFIVLARVNPAGVPAIRSWDPAAPALYVEYNVSNIICSLSNASKKGIEG